MSTSTSQVDQPAEAHTAEEPGSAGGALARIKTMAAGAGPWWRQRRIARALARYGAGNGGQLSGGIALSGLLSIAGALTLALTALVGVFRDHPDFADAVFDQIDTLLPGVIKSGPDAGDGLVTPEQLVLGGGWGIAGVIGALVLLNSALTVMGALRKAMRAMFGLRATGENFLIGKVRDLAGFLGLALSVLLTSAISVAAPVAFDWLHATFGPVAGLFDSRTALQLTSLGISFVVDAVVFAMLFRGVAGARVPWSQLWRGCLLGAVGTGVLRYLGASVVGNVSDKPLLAAVGAVATLLIWLNFTARVSLIVAAWTADPPARPKPDRALMVNVDHTPNYVSVSAPETLEWVHDSYSGIVALEQDRVHDNDEAGEVDGREPAPAEPVKKTEGTGRSDEPAATERWGGLIGMIRRRRRRRVRSRG